MACAICFDTKTTASTSSSSTTANDPEFQLIKICPSDEREICNQCYLQYVELLINESIPGTCPILVCPMCKVKSCIISPNYLKFLPNELMEKYTRLAKSLLSLQCGSCHTRNTLYLAESSTSTSDNNLFLENLNASVFHSLADDVYSYETGSISIANFFILLFSKYHQELTTNGSDIEWPAMKKILSLIRNPERKASLHLRYLKKNPFVSTVCCARSQCFECRTTDTHSGKTCYEISNSRPTSDLIKCPACSIFLVKGDGCDTVTCVCGSRFTFSSELQKFNQSNLFQESFPNNTADYCVQVLCGEFPESNLPLAKSWYHIHEPECQYSFLKYWQKKFPFCPTQCALILINYLKYYPHSGNSIEYIEKSRNMWIQHHQQEYQQLTSHHEEAQKSLWESFYPSDLMKTESIRRRSQDYVDYPLHSMTSKQKEVMNLLMNNYQQNNLNYQKNLQKLSKLRALQYVTLFGHFPVGLRELATSCPDGIPLNNSNLSTIDQTISSSQSLFLGGKLFFGVGDVVSSLLAIHQGGCGIITRYYEEDNTYDVNWSSFNHIERIHRNYLKFKGKGKVYSPHGAHNSEQLQIFKDFLKYLYVLLNKYSNEETKEDTPLRGQGQGQEQGLGAEGTAGAEGGYQPTPFESDLLDHWKQKCEENGVTPNQELRNIQPIIQIFETGDGMTQLSHPHELQLSSSFKTFYWRDLYGAVLYKLMLCR